MIDGKWYQCQNSRSLANTRRRPIAHVLTQRFIKENQPFINVSRIVPTARLRRTPILFPFSSFIVCTARACNNPHRLRDNALDFHASPAWTVLRGGHRSTPVGMPLTSLKVPLPSKQHSAPLRKPQSHRDLQSCRLLDARPDN